MPLAMPHGTRRDQFVQRVDANAECVGGVLAPRNTPCNMTATWGAARRVTRKDPENLGRQEEPVGRNAGRQTNRRAGALDFVRIDFDHGRDRGAGSHTSLPTEGTDPGFDGATSDKGHVKHCAVIWWSAGVKLTSGRLAAAL